MPKKLCCCNPLGRHVAVACRSYESHSIYKLDGTNVGYGGQDGFLGITFGPQKIFGVTAGDPSGFGGPVIVRGPYTVYLNENDVRTKKFDSTRDIIILSRGGGGASLTDPTEIGPIGGNSALIQSRLIASLDLEGSPGTGGEGYDGGGASFVGNQITQNLKNSEIIVGAGAGVGKNQSGGQGGVFEGTYGYGSDAGEGGSQIKGGSGGGSGGDGVELFGGDGGPNGGGGGGGGYYGGGGGDNYSGGGGGSSKQPEYDASAKYSEDGLNQYPGGVCDPFISYLNLDSTQPVYHAGLGGGFNNNQGDIGYQTVLGFGRGYNAYEYGSDGVITVVWVNKYCPCNENTYVLPDKMYICLTDAQYQILKDFQDNEPLGDRYLVKFDLDGETYFYFGICQNAYCDRSRLVDGTPTNIQLSGIPIDLPGPGQGTQMDDCCSTTLCVPYCKVTTPNCYDCNIQNDACAKTPVPKYCCDDIQIDDDNQNYYYSISNGWLWQCTKNPYFWYEFGDKPENPADIFSTKYERGCLPVTYTDNDIKENPSLLLDLCNGTLNDEGDSCANYDVNDSGSNCWIRLQGEFFPYTNRWPATVTSNVCDGLKLSYAYHQDPASDDPCSCTNATDDGYGLNCYKYGCVNNSRQFVFTLTTCEVNNKIYFDTKSCNNHISGSLSESAFQIPYSCQQEVLGYSQIIKKCTLQDGTKIDAASPLAFPPTGESNRGAIYQICSYNAAGINTCEKTVEVTPTIVTLPNGMGLDSKGIKLGTLINEISKNLTLDTTFIVHESNLWVNDQRIVLIDCEPYYDVLPGDKLSRIVKTENDEETRYDYYYQPLGYMFKARVIISDSLFSASYTPYRSSPPTCNNICICEPEKIEKTGRFGGAIRKYYYTDSPYYFYENNSGSSPDFTEGTFIPDPNLDPFYHETYGWSYEPDSWKTYLCKDNVDKDIQYRYKFYCDKLNKNGGCVPPDETTPPVGYTLQSSTLSCEFEVSITFENQ